MARLVLFNKPFGVLSQFTDADGRETLKDYIDLPGVYPAGRLDKDSEGLLLLTDDGRLQARLSHPRYAKRKRYWVQVERIPEPSVLQALQDGVTLKDGPARAQRVVMLDEPELWPRNPPVRYRKTVPTAWLSLDLTEGRNRQVRRMTAAIGHPTLRLVRVMIDRWNLDGLTPGDYRILSV